MSLAQRDFVQLIKGRAFLVRQTVEAHLSAAKLFDYMSGKDFSPDVGENDKEQQSIRIIGKDAYLVHEQIIKEVSTFDFARNLDIALNDVKEFDTGHLPQNVERQILMEDSVIYVTRIDPSVRPILYTGATYAEKDENGRPKYQNGRRYNIGLPYMYLIWKFMKEDEKRYRYSNVVAFSSPEIIKDDSDPIYRLPLPNTWKSGLLCTGDLETDGLFSLSDCGKKVDEFFSLWISAAFNDEIGRMPSSSIKTWEEWEQKTAQDPLFILEEIKETRLLKPATGTQQTYGSLMKRIKNGTFRGYAG